MLMTVAICLSRLPRRRTIEPRPERKKGLHVRIAVTTFHVGMHVAWNPEAAPGRHVQRTCHRSAATLYRRSGSSPRALSGRPGQHSIDRIMATGGTILLVRAPPSWSSPFYLSLAFLSLHIQVLFFRFLLICTTASI